MRTNIVICDTGPVLHLAELDCLNLLKDFQQVILPPTVVKEITKHRPDILNCQDVSFTLLTFASPLDITLLTLCRVFALHTGELEALALMQKYPHAIFLTDDSAARLVAQKMGYIVHGTIGILIRAIRRKFLKPQNVVEKLRMIPTASSLHIKPSLLEEIISKLNKEFNL